MPSTFKFLSSLTVWILFVLGCAFIIVNLAMWAGTGFAPEDWQMVAAYDALGVAAIFLSTIAIRLRKSLE